MQLGSKLFGMGGTKPTGGGDDPQTGETSAIPAIETEESVVISEPESSAPEEVLTPLDQIVTAAIAEMPIEDKVSALFFVTPEQLTGVSVATQAGNTTQEILQKYKVGGLLYTGNNAKSDDQLKELLSKTSAMDPGVFMATTEQGGEVSPIAKALKKEEQPAPLDIALSGGTDQATASGSAIGAYLKEYGFNLDLAPVADVAVDSSNTYLGKSSFGPDGNLAGQMSAAFVEGLASQGVSSCIVAFPGYGAVSGDEKEGMTTTARTREEMESAEFIAYKAAVNAGAEFLQIGTISAPGLTGDNTQCCLSGEAVRVVREDLGFEGVIVTGALNTAATTLYYDPADAAVRALKAGCDMIYLPEKFEEAYNGVLEAVQNGVLTQERIDESLIRIYRVKYKDRVAQ
jgi:beta-N-acetylhexosaminidase